LQEYLEEAGHLAHELESIKLEINGDLSQALALAASGEEPKPKELFSGLYA
jgi:TPP-dependent pyruvate/acetoin dehydrogenase alpha subunit